MNFFRNLIGDPKYFLNVDETAMYMNSGLNRTVHLKGKRGCHHAWRIIINAFYTCCTITMDGSKLNLFIIFKGISGRSIARSLPSILGGGIIGCIQSKAWMDNRAMTICCNSDSTPYIAGHDGSVGFLLGDFKCHHSERFNSLLEDNDVRNYKIPLHCTALVY